MSAQDDMLDRYQALMQVNAQSHLLRTAREVGILDVLQSGQATLEQLVERLGLQSPLAELLLDALVAMKVLEKYREDYALAGVTRLLCQYDADLGDRHWTLWAEQLKGGPRGQTAEYFDTATATQWVHTGAAKQVAEILDIGGERKGLKILDYGGGSAVWSAAIAYADPTCTVTVIDMPERLAAARRTIQSIELSERFEFQEASDDEQLGAASVPLPQDHFDLILVAGRVAGLSPEQDAERFRRWQVSLKEGGELVLVDLFRGPNGSSGPNLTESVEAIRIAMGTPAGHIRDAEKVRDLLMESGFSRCQFVFLAASRQGFGMLVSQKTVQSMR